MVHPWPQPGYTQTLSVQMNVYTLKKFNSFIEMKFTYHKIYLFKVQKSVGFSIFTELCNHHHDLFLKYLSSLQKEVLSHQQPLSIPRFPTPQPRQTLTYFLFSLIRLFRTFYVGAVIQYVPFYGWILSLCITFSRLIHVAA